MRNAFLLGSLVAFTFIVGCSKPKKEEPPPDSGAAATTPAIDDSRAIGFDPLGSDSGKIAGLNTIHFGYDKSSLTEESKRLLQGNAQWLKSNPKVTLQIEGHTDERGSNEYNLALGERRAKATRQYLEGLGIDSKRLTIISYGEEKPISTGEGESVWSQNRRANFVPLQ